MGKRVSADFLSHPYTARSHTQLNKKKTKTTTQAPLLPTTNHRYLYPPYPLLKFIIRI